MLLLLLISSIAGALAFNLLVVLLTLDNFANRFKLGFDNGKPYPNIADPKPKDGGKGKGKDKFQHLMARVKYAGTGAIAISGKIAGTVFTIGGQQGPFARVWAKPRNRRTAAQNFVRGILSGISTSWRTLSPAQADAWNAAGSGPGVSGYNLRKNVFGDSRKIDGSQLYQRVNNIILSVGGTTTATPPTTVATDAILAILSTASLTGPAFTSMITTFGGATAVPANTYLKVFATPQKGANQSFFGASDYRLLAVFPATTVINPLVLLSSYTAKFGTLSVGARIGLKMEFIFWDGVSSFSKGGSVNETVTVVP